jgi:hypothetical protein
MPNASPSTPITKSSATRETTIRLAAGVMEEILAKEEVHAEDMKTLIKTISEFEKRFEKQQGISTSRSATSGKLPKVNDLKTPSTLESPL